MCTFGFKLTQSFIALRFWHNFSLFFLYVKHNMSTNIDTTPILTCTFILKDEHQIFELLESINCTGVYIKKNMKKKFKKGRKISLQNNRRLTEFFSGLKFFKSQTCWLLNRVGKSWTVHFLIWLSLLKLCVFCLELKYLFVESNLKGICWFILTVTWCTVRSLYVQLHSIIQNQGNVLPKCTIYTLPQANLCLSVFEKCQYFMFGH